MFCEKSTYQCPICKNQKQDVPTKRFGCVRCNAIMEEIIKGVIKKQIAVEPPAQDMTTETAQSIVGKPLNNNPRTRVKRRR